MDTSEMPFLSAFIHSNACEGFSYRTTRNHLFLDCIHRASLEFSLNVWLCLKMASLTCITPKCMNREDSENSQKFGNLISCCLTFVILEGEHKEPVWTHPIFSTLRAPGLYKWQSYYATRHAVIHMPIM